MMVHFNDNFYNNNYGIYSYLPQDWVWPDLYNQYNSSKYANENNLAR